MASTAPTSGSSKTLDRRFVETGGVVAILPECMLVGFDRRSHNPLLRVATLDEQPVPIAWLGNRPVKLTVAQPQKPGWVSLRGRAS